MLSPDSQSCFMPGSKSIWIVSCFLGGSVNTSVLHEKGGEILRVIEVAKSPEFVMIKGFVIGIAGIPFSHMYLK